MKKRAISGVEEKTLGKIKEAILEIAKRHGVEVDKIILFGPRARGDYDEDSDWDILVVTKEEIDEKLLERFLRGLKIKLSIKMNIPNDIVIVSRKLYEERRAYVGDVSYYASIEGLVL